MTNLSDIQALNDELAGAVVNLAPYHAKMQLMCEYYKKSAFFPRKSGEKLDLYRIPDNYLQIFADKNIQYTSEMPGVKIVGTPEDRERANRREKILLAVWRKSGGGLLQKKWARDATKKSVAISAVEYDLNEHCAYVRRYDPRFVFWKKSNGNDERFTAFWAVFPITKKEAQSVYNVTPIKDTIAVNIQAKLDPYFNHMDGQEWFTMAIRWDDKHRTAWIGDKIIEPTHEHNIGTIPVDFCAPFPTEERNELGDFYLENMIVMQAELNETVRRRSNIVKRMSNPIIWGRQIQTRTYDDVKQALKDAETGVLGLGKDGEVGIMQLQEIKMLYEHEAALKSDMQRLSGFAAASFGESVGANTSGDALGMYFTPTQKHIDDQNISWKAFYESINAKILAVYDRFGATGEVFTLEGYAPRSTVLSLGGEDYSSSSAGDFTLQFTREDIGGNYINRAIPAPVLPKNEIEEKRLVKEAVSDKFLSRSTGYEMWGLESPEDEKQRVMNEMAEPLLNPDGVSTLLGTPPLQVPNTSSPSLPPPPKLKATV